MLTYRAEENESKRRKIKTGKREVQEEEEKKEHGSGKKEEEREWRGGRAGEREIVPR